MWISGCGLRVAASFTWSSNSFLPGSRRSFQYRLPSLSTATVMFSGLVWVGMLTAFGNCTGTVLLMTGIVMRKMISSTNMTSTRGVVLMLFITACSSPELPTLIAILGILVGRARHTRRWPAGHPATLEGYLRRAAAGAAAGRAP